MNMRNRIKGDHQVENHVVIYEPDRAIGWAPAEPGCEPAGHTWTWRLTPFADNRTLVTETYDGSGFKHKEMLDYLPVINQDQVQASLDRLAEALRESQTPTETPELEECQIGEKNTTDRSKRQPADGQVSAVPADKNPQDVTVGGSDKLSPALVWMLVGLLLAG